MGIGLTHSMVSLHPIARNVVITLCVSRQQLGPSQYRAKQTSRSCSERTVSCSPSMLTDSLEVHIIQCSKPLTKSAHHKPHIFHCKRSLRSISYKLAERQRCNSQFESRPNYKLSLDSIGTVPRIRSARPRKLD
jgi:hypothetical protein